MSSTSDSLNDKWFRLVGNPLSVVLFKLAQVPFFDSDWQTFFWKFLISLVFTVLAWEIARLIIIRARKDYSGLMQTRRRIGTIALGLAVEMVLLHLTISAVLFSTELAATFSYGFIQFWLLNAAIGFFVFVVIGGIYEAMYFFSQYKNSLQHAEELKKQQARASLDALKNRVNPHFLFNSLTTLSALIGEDAPRAERFVDELSKVYRHLLRAGRHPSMTLEEELDFAKSYSFLLENRFGEGDFLISFEKDSGATAPDKGRTLPALTFQNALDYLVRTQNVPLKIEVKVLETHLELTCYDHPKTLAFDASQSDWRHLENHGARHRSVNGQLLLEIPLSQNPVTTT